MTEILAKSIGALVFEDDDLTNGLNPSFEYNLRWTAAALQQMSDQLVSFANALKDEDYETADAVALDVLGFKRKEM